MSVQFIACSETSCPMNEDKQCRSPFVLVDHAGHCLIRENGPHDEKSQTESYVDLQECGCKKCAHWEENPYGAGDCGFRADLFFRRLAEGGPVCSQFADQIGEPGYTARL